MPKCRIDWLSTTVWSVMLTACALFWGRVIWWFVA